MRVRPVGLLVVALLVAGMLLGCPSPGWAAYPGANGKIAYFKGVRAPGDLNPRYFVYTANPDGSADAPLTEVGARFRGPFLGGCF